MLEKFFKLKINIYNGKYQEIPKSIFDFHFWTFIFVQFEKSEINVGKRRFKKAYGFFGNKFFKNIFKFVTVKLFYVFVNNNPKATFQ